MSYFTKDAVSGLSELENIQFIYMDPPYNTGRNFYNFDDKFKSSMDYRDNLIKPVLVQAKKALNNTGVIAIHVEPKISHHIRYACDEVFGENRFVNEVVWLSGGNHHSKKKMQRSHDTILIYSKTGDFLYNPLFKPYSEEYSKGSSEDERGLFKTTALKNSQPDVVPRPNLRYEWNGNYHQWWVSKEKMESLHKEGRLKYNNKGIPRKKIYQHELSGIPVKDVWNDVSQIQGGEKLYYATQKPVALLERFISMFSSEGDLVCDPFAGSGTTGRACINLNREYILFDINKEAKQLFDSSIA